MKQNQPPPIPEDLWQLMDRLGPGWGQDIPGNIRSIINGFTPLLARCPKAGVIRQDNLHYGPHERQIADVFRPESMPEGCPVVLFFHGGAFVDGNKNRSEEVYANVLYFLARHGICGINVEYRLAPESQYPDGLEDVGLALSWAMDHAEEWGADPNQIFLFGHSAGAAHAAGFAYQADLPPKVRQALRGLIIVSGRVRADILPENPNAKKVAAYYGTDPVMLEKYSPVTMVNAESIPTMVAVAEYENPLIDVYCAELIYRLAAAKRRAPRFLWLARHNHTSIIAHINTAENKLGAEILEFIRLGK